ncbi:DUF4298 domain-containing protein [Ornithobacterium rhinotracheale]|uniref:DUF4298 domain-containing protein n=1 Tax=Ornithobacterium rhinotracheale TaxID=28251 RepID=UPI001FF24B12|nr:DUF4298 domain-containing protein [Ornithobacterium rhinotracheale]MCK0205794.1 DUF4298 domain-containing protein [Ornithobacterium rhinotracheale]
MKEISLKEAEKRMEACEEDLKVLQDFNQAMDRIAKNIALLDEYYGNQYLKDVQNTANKDVYSAVLSEDGIWNLLAEIHWEKIDILKKIVKDLR